MSNKKVLAILKKDYKLCLHKTGKKLDCEQNIYKNKHFNDYTFKNSRWRSPISFLREGSQLTYDVLDSAKPKKSRKRNFSKPKKSRKISNPKKSRKISNPKKSRKISNPKKSRKSRKRIPRKNFN